MQALHEEALRTDLAATRQIHESPPKLGAGHGRKGWKTTINLVNHRASTIRARLERSDSKRTLIANNAAFARQVLEEFAAIHRPRYTLWKAMLFGTFIDVFVLLRLPVGGPLTRAIIRHGGPEQLRFLFCVATFDANRDGEIDDQEWASYEKLGDLLISDSVAMCGNMGIVGALLLGLTHLITMGRPVPYVLSEGSEREFGSGLLWVAYAFNAASECGAFFTLCLAVITRNNLTNILPTRELKVDMLRSTNALGVMGVSLMITLWFFLLSTGVGTLVASPKEGFIAAGCVLLCTLAFVYYVAPIRFMAVLLLHEEVKRFMIDKSGSFQRQAAANQAARVRVPAGSFCRKVLDASRTCVANRLTKGSSASESKRNRGSTSSSFSEEHQEPQKRTLHYLQSSNGANTSVKASQVLPATAPAAAQPSASVVSRTSVHASPEEHSHIEDKDSVLWLAAQTRDPIDSDAD